MSHGLFPELVTLDLETHTYKHKITGLEYAGFSSVFENISRPFYSGVAKFVANKENVSVTEIHDRWDSQRNEGNLIDDALTEYCRTGLADEELKPALNLILAHYSEYNKCHEQLIVYSERFRTATAIDKIGIYTNRKDSSFAIGDFKCFETMELFEHKGWLKAPFTHLPDNKYTKICLQLSYGAYHLEELTGKRPKKLFIHLIQPSTVWKKSEGELKLNQQIVQCPYMKSDIQLLLHTFEDKIKETLSTKNQTSMSINELI